jgi:gamma-glutamyltranspeptidase/glutathione hydrolase
VLGAALLLALALPHSPSRAQPAQSLTQPEAASGWTPKTVVRARQHMAVTAHPLATQAADQTLRAGGSAVDAAIAAQLVLGLVEPQSSGIGGGAFMLIHDAHSGRVSALDGRETAPAGADESLLSDRDGKPLAFAQAVAGGLSVGVPGLIRLIETAHRQHGRLAWPMLFEPAIRLAREGFSVGPRLHRLISQDRFISRETAAASYFLDPSGQPWPVGHVLRNPALADTLNTLAQEGAEAFYRGALARDIEIAVRSHPRNPGQLTASDLAAYRVIEREPLCFARPRHWICGMPPPSSGAITVGQIIHLFDLAQTPAPSRTPLVRDGVLSEPGTHRFLEAARLAFADRNRWIADPAFVPQPAAGLLSTPYLTERAKLMGERAAEQAPHGLPEPATTTTIRADAGTSHHVELELESTTHLAIVDQWGNAVSMTASIEDAFGSRLMVRGFLLNNQLTDFSVASSTVGTPPANRPQPGKRPRSSMAPTVVFDRRVDDGRGDLRLLIGSPGGANIVSYVARTLIAVLDEDMHLQQAIELPNLGNRNGPSEVEAGRVNASLIDALRARGHQIRTVEMTSGLHGIHRVCAAPHDCELVSGVDPRREGTAIGR